MAGKSRFWLRRFRSSSFSSDLDVDQEGTRVEGVNETVSAQSRPCAGSNRTLGAYKTRSYVQMTPIEMAGALTAGLELLHLDSEAFPFQVNTFKILKTFEIF